MARSMTLTKRKITQSVTNLRQIPTKEGLRPIANRLIGNSDALRH